MLHFIIGTAGTGKTTRLVEEIRRSVERGRRAILLIPEQFSFEGEKLLYTALGPAKSLEVQVLSFTRLCTEIFRRLGGLAGVELTVTAKYLLLSIALDEMKDSLTVYRKSASNTSFLDALLAACAEFKAAAVTPQRLEQAAAESDDAHLKSKLQELAAIYGAYQALLDQGYSDPEDCLIRACSRLENADFFAGCDVFIDSFAAFMAGEYGLLRHILRQAGDVWFAMTAATPYEEQGGMGLFSAVTATMERLRRMARENAVPVATPEILAEPRRYKSGELAFVSRFYLDRESPAWEEEPRDILLRAAADPYDEAEQVAGAVAALVREGYRYREIAVVARDVEPYRRALEYAFGRYGIPLHTSQPEDIENQTLMGALLAALDAVRTNYDTQAILLLAKSPVMGLAQTAVAELENYCYIWNVRGAVWLQDFVGNPRGLAEGMDEADMLRLTAINETRRAIITPLEALRPAARSGAGRPFAGGIYDFLVEIQAAAHLNAYGETLPQGKREAFLDENAQLWDMLMGILDVFGSVLRSANLPWQKLCELFRLGASAAELSTPPQTLDGVIAGNADRIRPGQVRAVFVMGANEGVFPPAISGAGMFSESERGKLAQAGLELSRSPLGQVMLERYFTYFALTLPSEKLWVSYLHADLQGREQQPSLIVSQMQILFPRLKNHRAADKLRGIGGAATAYDYYAAHFRDDTPLRATLHAYFASHHPELAARLETAARKAPHALTETATARSLFGGTLRLSPSRVERFYLCAFSYFAADGLKLRRRQRVEFSPLEAGSVIHHVLHIVMQNHGGKGLAELSKPELEEEIGGVIDGYIASRVENPASLPTRFRYQFTRLRGTLARLLRHFGKEFAQSKFEPAAYEMPIELAGEVKPLQLQTPDGASVIVEGVVDRVDVMHGKNGQTYVRVVDYKSGRKDFQLRDIVGGLNLQMLLYLFTIAENGGERFGENIPAGVLYMPVREQFISAPRTAEDSAILSEHAKNWKMSGLLLDDEEVLRGMEADVAGVFIPAKMKKDGTLDGRSSLASLARMGKLAEAVKEQIVAMGEALHSGNIAAKPVEDVSYPACTYCDYRAVCGFEEGDPIREIAKLDREEVLRMLDSGAF